MKISGIDTLSHTLSQFFKIPPWIPEFHRNSKRIGIYKFRVQNWAQGLKLSGKNIPHCQIWQNMSHSREIPLGISRIPENAILTKSAQNYSKLDPVFYFQNFCNKSPFWTIFFRSPLDLRKTAHGKKTTSIKGGLRVKIWFRDQRESC